MRRIKKALTSVLIGSMLITPCASVSASMSDSNMVYLSDAKERQYTAGGVTVHEYIWSDKKPDNVSLLSELTNAEWRKTKIDGDILSGIGQLKNIVIQIQSGKQQHNQDHIIKKEKWMDR